MSNAKPADDVVRPLEAPYEDARGSIQPILSEEVRDVAIIRSVKGAVRGNHYHRTDSHHSYVMSGSLEYVWRPLGSAEAPARRVIRAGEMFFTPPMVEHAMVFLEDTVFLNLSANPRAHEDYEADVVRVALVALP
jgi:quercetin dioxygenase-like cupin family protein